jgi:hypothetical protein
MEICEHMEVVDANDQHVGIVEKIEGDRITRIETVERFWSTGFCGEPATHGPAGALPGPTPIRAGLTPVARWCASSSSAQRQTCLPVEHRKAREPGSELGRSRSIKQRCGKSSWLYQR